MQVIVEATSFQCASHVASASTADFIAATSAFIAFLALCATLYASWLQRTNSRLSAKPLMEIDLNPEPSTLILRNSGLGPALVDSISAVFDGKTYDLLVENQLEAFIAQMISGLVAAETDETEEGPLSHQFTVLSNRTVISAGETMPIIFIHTEEEDDWNVIHGRFANTELKIEYHSIYKERDTAFLDYSAAKTSLQP